MRAVPTASTLLTPDQLAAVRARSDVWGIYLVAHAWAVIIAAMAMFTWFPHVVTYIFAVMLIGSRQLGLLILMHDGAHGALGKTPAVNRFLAQVFCAWPTLADVRIYRAYHLKHHTRTQQADDPDLVLTGHYPITRASLRRKLWRDISGQTGFSQRKAQFRHALGSPDQPLSERVRHYWRELGPQTLTQAVVLLGCSWAGHAWLYVALWLVPLLTWQQVVLRIRNIAEHAVVRDADDHFGNARTTLVSPLERVFVAPYWVNYHLEHHLVFWVPCYRLKRLRQSLLQNGYGDRIETEAGYLAVLRKVTVDAPDDERGERKRASGTFASGFEAR